MFPAALNFFNNDVRSAYALRSEIKTVKNQSHRAMPGYILATNYKVNSASDHYRLWQRCARQIYFTLHHITDICHWPCVVQSLLERVVHVLVDGPLFTASQPHTHTIQSTSSMYHYECIAPCKDTSLQRADFAPDL